MKVELLTVPAEHGLAVLGVNRESRHACSVIQLLALIFCPQIHDPIACFVATHWQLMATAAIDQLPPADHR